MERATRPSSGLPFPAPQRPRIFRGESHLVAIGLDILLSLTCCTIVHMPTWGAAIVSDQRCTADVSIAIAIAIVSNCQNAGGILLLESLGSLE